MKIIANALLAGTVILTGTAALAQPADAAMTASQKKAEKDRLFYEIQRLQTEYSKVSQELTRQKNTLQTRQTAMKVEFQQELTRKLAPLNEDIAKLKSQKSLIIAQINKSHDAKIAQAKAAKLTSSQLATATKSIEESRKNEIAIVTKDFDARIAKLNDYKERETIATKAKQFSVYDQMTAEFSAKYIAPLQKLLSSINSQQQTATNKYNAL